MLLCQVSCAADIKVSQFFLPGTLILSLNSCTTKGVIKLGKFSLDLQSKIVDFCAWWHTAVVFLTHCPVLPWSWAMHFHNNKYGWESCSHPCFHSQCHCFGSCDAEFIQPTEKEKTMEVAKACKKRGAQLSNAAAGRTKSKWRSLQAVDYSQQGSILWNISPEESSIAIKDTRLWKPAYAFFLIQMIAGIPQIRIN